MSRLENLKKQAKTYLRWHREHHHPVAEEIRRNLARYQEMTDLEIFATSFKLSDSQELIAKKAGHNSWRELTASLALSSPSAVSPPVRLLTAQPQLFVTDIARSCSFYKVVLGFSIAFQSGEPAFYAQIFRDEVRLNLRWIKEPIFNPQNKEPDLLAASITVNNAKVLFLEFKKAGANSHPSLRTEPWGARLFIVRDPDGNLLAFAGPGSSSSDI